ncbi:hypothetical protein TNCV_3670791 [Trichonephila clavipes]|nr:hypothetical protein TNCV_3670791 [Trichonephila clavipes]
MAEKEMIVELLIRGGLLDRIIQDFLAVDERGWERVIPLYNVPPFVVVGVLQIFHHCTSVVDLHHKEERRADIHFLFVEGVQPEEVIRRMQATYDDCTSREINSGKKKQNVNKRKKLSDLNPVEMNSGIFVRNDGMGWESITSGKKAQRVMQREILQMTL